MTAETKLYQYEVTCAGGFEDVLVDEIRSLLGKRVEGLREERGEVGRIFFQYEGSPRKLLELECAAGIAAIVAQMHDVTVGKPGLERISQGVGQLPLPAMTRLARLANEGIDAAGYQLRVHQRGSHRFEVSDTEAALVAALSAQGLSPSHAGFDLEFRLQKRRAQLKLSLRHASHAGAIEQRGIPAAMVASIVTMLGLDDTDDLLLIHGHPEAAAAARRICGSQVACVRRARPGTSQIMSPPPDQAACPGTGPRSIVVGADDHLPIQAGSMTAAILVTADDEATMPGSAADRLSQAVACVAEEGVIAALVPRSDAFAARLPQWGLPVEVMGALPVYVRRRRWALFLLSRLDLLQLA
ncbi:MAG: hypothetical protein HN712_23925 [Gemmatimonadetes bacterium]|jgi:hypothetical protein|nr:hypothetical protein [Gemmatimonadota bacterium]MBT7863387.1 hypothetical protein [Gemmatimonadota bacterium]